MYIYVQQGQSKFNSIGSIRSGLSFLQLGVEMNFCKIKKLCIQHAALYQWNFVSQSSFSIIGLSFHLLTIRPASHFYIFSTGQAHRSGRACGQKSI